jgi:hypothetical protein
VARWSTSLTAPTEDSTTRTWVAEDTEEQAMSKVCASITTSVDGYIAGPDDGPAMGLGRGGERLH